MIENVVIIKKGEMHSCGRELNSGPLNSIHDIKLSENFVRHAMSYFITLHVNKEICIALNMSWNL